MDCIEKELSKNPKLKYQLQKYGILDKVKEMEKRGLSEDEQIMLIRLDTLETHKENIALRKEISEQKEIIELGEEILLFHTMLLILWFPPKKKGG